MHISRSNKKIKQERKKEKKGLRSSDTVLASATQYERSTTLTCITDNPWVKHACEPSTRMLWGKKKSRRSVHMTTKCVVVYACSQSNEGRKLRLKE
jgi:hypothetical protein